MRLIPSSLAVLAACGALAAVAGCGSPQTPMQRNAAAHPAVPCSRIAAQVTWLQHYSQQLAGFSTAASTAHPYPRMQKLADALSNVSNGSGTRLAVAEVNYESDEGWLSPNEGGLPFDAVLRDIGRLATICH